MEKGDMETNYYINSSSLEPETRNQGRVIFTAFSFSPLYTQGQIQTKITNNFIKQTRLPFRDSLVVFI